MRFIIDGVDITGLIIEDGVDWQRNDIDGDNAGRSLGDANMIRDRKAIKNKLTITCRPLTLSEVRMLQRLLEPEFVTMQYTDPLFGDISQVMYSNNTHVTYSTIYSDGDAYFKDITFPLVFR